MMTAPTPSPVTESMVKRGAAEVYRVYEDRPLYAQGQMNGVLAEELARACLTAALDGMVVVPREPTKGMIIAGCENNPTQWTDETYDGFAAEVANDVYRAMIAAATPPAAQGE